MTAPQTSAVGQGQPSASYDERLVDAKLATTEARLETRIVQVEAKAETNFEKLIGKLDLVVQGLGDLKGEVAKLDGKIGEVDGHARTGKREIIIAIVATGLSVIALVWGGVQIFQSGLSLTQGAFQAGIAAEQVKQDDQPKASPRQR